MNTWFWSILVILFIVFMVIVARRSKYLKEYWREVKPSCWNDGFILNVLKVVFFSLSVVSVGVIIPYVIKRRWSDKAKYISVDAYVLFWFVLIFIIWLFGVDNAFVVILLVYRLFEILQSWVSQYVLGGVPVQWEPRNINRSLVLVFIDYGQVIFSYAALALILGDNFQNIACQSQAFSYSLGIGFLIGSDFQPITGIGYLLLSTQIMFAVLFLTAAVNRIFASIK